MSLAEPITVDEARKAISLLSTGKFSEIDYTSCWNVQCICPCDLACNSDPPGAVWSLLCNVHTRERTTMEHATSNIFQW